jgi:hypothetical protein
MHFKFFMVGDVTCAPLTLLARDEDSNEINSYLRSASVDGFVELAKSSWMISHSVYLDAVRPIYYEEALILTMYSRTSGAWRYGVKFSLKIWGSSLQRTGVLVCGFWRYMVKYNEKEYRIHC